MIRRLIFGLFTIGLVIVAAGAWWVSEQWEKPMAVNKPELFTVQQGDSAHRILQRLRSQGFIQQHLPYRILLKVHPDLSHVQTGTYELTPQMTVREALLMIHNGQEKQFDVSLVEGLRWQEWITQLNQHPHLKASELSMQEWVARLDPGLPGQHLEGWLMPDTYHVTHGTSVENVVHRAYQAMHAYLHDAWAQRDVDLPLETPYQALILASIVEKETGLASERPLIAGVFTNRLRQNMRLQTDPTVIYGMGERFDGNIRRRDLREKTPYNTYVIRGLPPTPIAMPSKAAIDAVMHPQQTSAVYFVAKGDGSHVFSDTLEQHNAAVRRYQLKQGQ
ncbi:endolytic transglycosylase MltG [Aestuariibacter halophilus]|uniref:Endolytic murein transglycosylase n=1 Tax=Fluctibacter halophilus TaxID=226011 RepID=A0ABS8G6C6_9ALTE|nr:endolytic transglycosylase MltG [Aestuariibacter halophilus]MCC2615636.1 endolytic transglycosylase MltG [Aestuariibacter halophilus]